jgi:hypothetical protein
MEDTYTHKPQNRGHDYLFSPIVTFYGTNGEERLLNGYQVFAMIEQILGVHRNKKERTEVRKKHLKELKK